MEKSESEHSKKRVLKEQVYDTLTDATENDARASIAPLTLKA